jgi:squalene synthase HpnC
MPKILSESVDHYENFPVASWLCPPHLRAPIAAIYHFARTADDLADEGDASAQERLEALSAYRKALQTAMQSADVAHPSATSPTKTPQHNWPHVFGPLHQAISQFKLPVQLLDDLLDAFVQDVGHTAQQHVYANLPEVLDYCRRSANPVGRLLLHLYGVTEDTALKQSDAICTALQLINFWQDLGQDLSRGRNYLNAADLAQHQLALEDVLQWLSPSQTAPTQTFQRFQGFMTQQVQLARQLMLFGAPLVHRVPGRAGWELRLVVQGGLRILDKIEALNYNTLHHRPKLLLWDGGLMLWRALWM